MYVFWFTALMRNLLVMLSPALAKPSSGKPFMMDASYLYTYVLPGEKSGARSTFMPLSVLCGSKNYLKHFVLS